MSEEKIAFANTLAVLYDLPLIANECVRYGMISGCDAGCPALWKGHCDVSEVVIPSLDIDEEQEEELRALYKGER